MSRKVGSHFGDSEQVKNLVVIVLALNNSKNLVVIIMNLSELGIAGF